MVLLSLDSVRDTTCRVHLLMPTPISIDTETTALHVDDGGVTKVISIRSAKSPTAKVFLLDEMGSGQIKQLYRRVASHNLIMHNSPFDVMFLERGHVCGVPLVDNLEWDTLLVSRIIEQILPDHGLKFLAEHHFGPEVTEPERVMYQWLKENTDTRKKSVDKSLIYLAPKKILTAYAAMDAELTWLLWKLQREQVANISEEWPQIWELIHREMQMAKLLAKMARVGVGWDQQAANAVVKKLDTELERLRKSLPFGTKPNEVREFYFEKHGFVGTPTKSGKQLQVGEQARKDLMKVNAPHIHKYDRWIRLSKAQSMWYKGWTDKCGVDGRLRTEIKQSNTVNFRFSVGRIQLQAIPHDEKLTLPKGVPSVKSLFKPKDGHLLWELDVNQAEVRVATAISKCIGMREIILGGGDLHSETCKRIFAIDEDNELWDRFRTISKRLRFGTIYGIGVRGMKDQIFIYTGVDYSEAAVRDFLNRDRKLFPEFVSAAKRAEQGVCERGYAKMRSGMRRYFKPGEDTHKAFNAIIQGNVQQAMIDWMLACQKDLVLQVHDSLVYELPENESIEPIVQKGVQVFEQMFNIPFKIEAKQWK